jgi:hypothetical protein
VTSLDAVELVMALESWALESRTDKIGPDATLGDLHWLLVRKERERAGRRRSSDEIWSKIAKTLEECGVPKVQIKPDTKIEDLIS